MTDDLPTPGPVRPSMEFVSFLTALNGVDPGAPTWCPGWTAHDLLAHLVAGAQEITRLVDASLAGLPVPPTRGFEEREAPLREAADADVRAMLLTEGARLGASLGRLHLQDPGRTVPFTGWGMTARQLQTHVRSELAVHRWDLVGDDEVSGSLLGQPDLLDHAWEVRRGMTGLAEAGRPLPGDLDDLPAARRLLAIWGRVRH
ncbi:MAG: maleylpyruvate isomerase N-terminal domain-containing protein [Actinobacteria bacterium]|nr:maleylpyruvate isomerase N-terminal domain-containing protein [Actinomycetota bacterium]